MAQSDKMQNCQSLDKATGSIVQVLKHVWMRHVVIVMQLDTYQVLGPYERRQYTLKYRIHECAESEPASLYPPKQS